MKLSLSRRLLVSVTALLVVGVAAPVSAGASPPRAHHAAKKKKKKSSAKVRCAAVLKCKGKVGPPGPMGLPGPAGPQGTSSGGVVTRIRGGAATTAQCATVAACPDQAYAVTGGTWTQPAGQYEHIGGTLNITAPTTMACNNMGMGDDGDVSITLDGTVVDPEILSAGPTATSSRTLTPADLPAPATATNHTLTVKIGDNCTGSGHFTINGLGLDVLGFS